MVWLRRVLWIAVFSGLAILTWQQCPDPPRKIVVALVIGVGIVPPFMIKTFMDSE